MDLIVPAPECSLTHPVPEHAAGRLATPGGVMDRRAVLLLEACLLLPEALARSMNGGPDTIVVELDDSLEKPQPQLERELARSP